MPPISTIGIIQRRIIKNEGEQAEKFECLTELNAYLSKKRSENHQKEFDPLLKAFLISKR